MYAISTSKEEGRVPICGLNPSEHHTWGFCNLTVNSKMHGPLYTSVVCDKTPPLESKVM